MGETVSNPAPAATIEPYPAGTRIRLKHNGRYLIIADMTRVCGSVRFERMSSARACDKNPGHVGRHRYLLCAEMFDPDPRLRGCYYWVAELIGVPKEFLA